MHHFSQTHRAAALALALAATACSEVASTTPAGAAAGSDVAVTINPTSATIGLSGQVAFAAGVTGTADTAVTWTIQEGATGGSVTAGSYRAPSAAGVYHVVATSTADPTKSASATVTVTATASLTIAPATASVAPRGSQAFSASGGSGTGYAWSLATNASGGSINAGSGLYTAGATGGVTDVVRVTDSLSNVATRSVTVTAVTPVTVSITPSAPTVNECQTVTFAATVAGSSNTAVTWSVQEGSPGGTITAGGVYTAPSNVGTYHVVATSQADATRSATVAVPVAAKILSVAVTPATASVATGGTAQLVATVVTTCGTFTAQ